MLAVALVLPALAQAGKSAPVTWSSPFLAAHEPPFSQASGGFRGLSCQSASFCAAADEGGNVLTSSDPTGGFDAWHAKIRSVRDLGAIGCSDRSRCVAVGGIGNAIASVPKAHRPPNTKISRLKVNGDKRKARVKFRGTDKTLGFQCKLRHSGRARRLPWGRCSSPEVYTGLHHGGYDFGVRAVNACGPDPSPARASFASTR